MQVPEEPVNSRLDEVQYLLEPLGAAVVRVRHLHQAQVRGKLEQERKLSVMSCWRDLSQPAQIGMVHSQQEVVVKEIFGDDLTRSVLAQIVPAKPRGLDGTRIGRFTDVVPVGASGINCGIERRRGGACPQHGLREG